MFVLMEQGIITKSWLQYFTAEVLAINKVLTYVKVSIRKILVIFSDNSMSVLHDIENQESKNPLVNRVRKVYWNYINIEYTRFQISMNKAHMSKTHIYGSKLTCNCCNCWRYEMYTERENTPPLLW